MQYKDENENPNIKGLSDKQIHRMFKIGGFLLIIYVIYSMYNGGGAESPIISREEASQLTDSELDARIAESIKKITDTPEYRQVKDFATYVESDIVKLEPKVLKAKGGVLLFIPHNQIEADKKIEIGNDEVKFTIDPKKLTPMEKNPAPQVEGGIQK
jgi:hypothetical protein